MNLLWALPTHLAIAFALFENRQWVRQYFALVLLINLLLLVTWAWLPQLLHYSLIPIVLALSLRAYAHFRLVEKL
jgi:hypothetical protein